MMESTFLTIQSRGTLALPPELRRRHGLDEPGTQVEVVEREDGVIELHPFVAVPRANLVVLDDVDSAFFAEQLLAAPRAGSARAAAPGTTSRRRKSS